MNEAESEAEHRIEWDHFGWSCSCGRNSQWPLAPEGRARAAAMRHQASEWKKAYRAQRSVTQEARQTGTDGITRYPYPYPSGRVVTNVNASGADDESMHLAPHGQGWTT